MKLREAVLAACRATGISPTTFRLAMETIERETDHEPTFNELLDACDDAERKAST